jgi:hypothetical protein
LEKDYLTSSPLRSHVEALAPQLRELHQALILVARAEYEQQHGAIPHAGALLQLLVSHVDFRWLRALSKLMADIDELLDNAVFTDTDAMAVRFEVEALISPSSPSETEFIKKYKEALQRVPSIVIIHSNVRKEMQLLPRTGKKEMERVRKARHSWTTLRTTK